MVRYGVDGLYHPVKAARSQDTYDRFAEVTKASSYSSVTL